MSTPVVDIYLIFDGNAKDAVRFYEKTLGGKLEMMMTMGESPMAEHCPPTAKDLIMHACLDFDGRKLMASDDMPGQPHKAKNGFGVTLTYESVEEAGKIFAALAEGGTTTMKMEPTFWAESFGMCTDKFGTHWMVSGKPKPAPYH
ncbi:MAG: VOC family protein [Burkholderiaceae bacterium]